MPHGQLLGPPAAPIRDRRPPESSGAGQHREHHNLALGLLRLAGIAEITRTLQRIAVDRTRIISVIADATSTTRL